MNYINLRRGLASKAKLIPLSDDIYDYIKDKESDWYMSLFQYNDNHKDILATEGTLAGIKDVKTDIIYFDFDDETNPNNAKNDAITLCKRLEDKGIKDYNICFSGMKGFSVDFYTKELFTPKQFKKIIVSLAGDLKTFDVKVCDPQRIVRVPNTKHQKSGLFKIPMSLDELSSLTMDEILSNAIKPNFDAYKATYIECPKEIIPVVEEEPKTAIDLGDFDVKNRPAFFDEARWMLNNGIFENGERNTALLCLASFYKSLGYVADQTYRILKGTAELQSKRTGTDRYPDEELYNNIIMSVYSPTWRGGVFSIRDPESWLYKYAKKHDIDVAADGVKASKFTDIETDFVDFVKNIEQNTIKTGIKFIDENMLITTGSVMGILGPASSGKTSVTLDILNHTSLAGVPSVFASLDMYRTRIFEKLIYRVTEGKFDRKKIYEMYKTGEYKDINQKIKDEFGNVYFYDKSSPTVQDIREYVLEVEKTSGQKVKLVMIDYFERISSDMSDDTAASKRIMGEIQDLMNDLNLCVIVLYQPNKMSIGSGPDIPILNYTAIKGSSFVFQSLRNIVSICRYGQNVKWQDYDKYINFNILKNDLGTLGSCDMHWTGRTGRIRELEDHETVELKEFLKLKEMDSGGQNKSEWS